MCVVDIMNFVVQFVDLKICEEVADLLTSERRKTQYCVRMWDFFLLRKVILSRIQTMHKGLK